MIKKYYSVCDFWGNEVFGTYDKEEAQNYFLDNDDEHNNDLQVFQYKEVTEIGDDGFNWGSHLQDKQMRNYWRFVLCCNLTPSMNRITATKIYARFVGGYCEGLEPKTVQIMGMLFEELAQSIHNGENKQAQQAILNGAINYLLKY